MKALYYDSAASAIYLRLNNNNIYTTVPISNSAFLDIDKDNKIVGIEILDVNDLYREEILSIKNMEYYDENDVTSIDELEKI